MRFFRSRASAAPPTAPSVGPDAAIDAFWAWWVDRSASVAEAIAQGQARSWAEPIGTRVAAIDARLAWELAPGRVASHALVLSPEGDPEVRPIALRWKDRGPDPDPTWEYHASRQAGPLGILEVNGTRVDLAAMQAVTSWNDSWELLDLRFWHPAFAGLPPEAARQIAFLFLDGLLGEDDVERWVGRIDLATAPIGGRTHEELRAEVARRAASATGDGWVLAQRDDPPAVIMANAALKRIDVPLADHHLAVTLDAGLQRLSGDQSAADAANAAQDRLTEALAGIAVDVGRITEQRLRVLHYVTADGGRAREIAERWAASERALRPRIEVKRDPRWSFRAQLTG